MEAGRAARSWFSRRNRDRALTVEREGIRRYEKFALTSTQQTVEVPITEADIPNVYVSVLLIRGRTSNDVDSAGNDPGKPAFRLGYTELTVADVRGPADVIAGDVQTPPEIEKIAVAVPTSRAPAPGEVTLWAVDYGVLSHGIHAAGRRQSRVSHKALQVMNEDSRQRIISRRVLTPKGGDEGGGGGNESGFRRDFRPTAFWLGSVETDSSGRATKDVTLPESLTTYRIMAVAGDTASRFGSAGAEIKVSKPVTLIAAFPRSHDGRPRVVRRGGDEHAPDRRRCSRHDSQSGSASSISARRRRQRCTSTAARLTRCASKRSRRASARRGCR